MDAWRIRSRGKRKKHKKQLVLSPRRKPVLRKTFSVTDTLPYIVKPPHFVISIPTKEEEHILKLQGSLHSVKCFALLRSSRCARDDDMGKGGVIIGRVVEGCEVVRL